MKKHVLLLAALFVLLSAASTAADVGISVGSPYLVTQWCIGKDLDINWSRWGEWEKLDLDPGYRLVRIVLVSASSGMRPRMITDGIPGHLPHASATGKFVWPIPGDVVPGEYHVRVMTMNKLIKGESEVFSIISCPPLARIDVTKRTLREYMTLSGGRIAGRVSGFTDSFNLAGRKIRVLLKKAGALVASTDYTLDAQGSINYLFVSLPLGIYEISVEKVATPVTDPAHTLNICFQGTAPALRTAVIASGSLNITGQDFAIQYAVAFNMNGSCW